MKHLTTVLFRSRILGFVPGWLALILVLGGTALAAAPVFNGNIRAGIITAWINTYAYGASTSTSIVSQSSSGQVATTSASRTSDQSGAPGSATAIGSMAWGFNDKTGGYSSWAQYSEARSYNYASVGPTITNEQDITNFGASAQQFDPYKFQYGQSSGNATINLWLASGGNCTVSNPCYNPNGGGAAASTSASLAIGILNNGSDYLEGIQFGYNALHGNDGHTVGQTAPAVVLPEGDRVDWQFCNNTTSFPANCALGSVASSIWSKATGNANSADIVFQNAGVLIQPHGAATSTSLQVNNGSVVAGAQNGATYNPGDLVGSETASCGGVRFGGSSSEGVLDYGCNASGLFNFSAPIRLGSTGVNTINSNTTGSAAAFVLNDSNGTPTTGDLLDIQLGGSTKLQVLNSGAVLSQSTLGWNNGPTISSGSGAPVGACTAGAVYTRTDLGASAGAEMYVCRNVTGTGTWEAVSGG